VIRTLIDLGVMPLMNNLCSTEAESLAAEVFPLRATIDDALLVKLDLAVPVEKMFSRYLYRSGINEPYVRHCGDLWRALAHLNPAHVIDIGGNDGTLLATFQSLASRRLQLTNVDASASFIDENTKKGIDYVNAYWGTVDVEPADIIVSTNVFQHNPDFKTFLRGIKAALRPHGLWVLEFPYFLRTAETLQFDQFYHEHVYYWLLTPLIAILADHGLVITGVSEHSIHGGTMRVQVRHAAPKIVPADVTAYLAREATFDFDGWSERVAEKIASDAQHVANLQGEVVGFGAAAKGGIYLHATGCFKRLSRVVDDTLQKQGRYVPRTALKVAGRNYLQEAQPDYVLVLAHNFFDHIAQSLRPWYRGNIIAMLPAIRMDRLAD
jgi:SAM-dependent methyltransferase